MDLLIVGNAGGTNVGASLHRAARSLGLTSNLSDARSASSGPRIASTLSWRLLGHRSLNLDKFSRSVEEECRLKSPGILVSTGLAPVDAAALEAIGEMGIVRINYSTDDPWNPAFKSRWFFAALRMYDQIYTVRRSNLDDFRAHGCRNVQYLPFGYDESLWLSKSGSDEPVADCHPAPSPANADVFFAGAADEFRIPYIRALVNSGIRVALAGDYWKRVPDLRKWAVGHLSSAQLKAYTAAVPISLCLVRRTNRDGHVMRSFEIPAIGACMIAEDTSEHREIFGEDGVAVRYFVSPEQATEVSRELLADRLARQRLAAAAQAKIVSSANAYTDRLAVILSSVDGQSSPAHPAVFSKGTIRA